MAYALSKWLIFNIAYSLFSVVLLFLNFGIHPKELNNTKYYNTYSNNISTCIVCNYMCNYYEWLISGTFWKCLEWRDRGTIFIIIRHTKQYVGPFSVTFVMCNINTFGYCLCIIRYLPAHAWFCSCKYVQLKLQMIHEGLRCLGKVSFLHFSNLKLFSDKWKCNNFIENLYTINF